MRVKLCIFLKLWVEISIKYKVLLKKRKSYFYSFWNFLTVSTNYTILMFEKNCHWKLFGNWLTVFHSTRARDWNINFYFFTIRCVPEGFSCKKYWIQWISSIHVLIIIFQKWRIYLYCLMKLSFYFNKYV